MTQRNTQQPDTPLTNRPDTKQDELAVDFPSRQLSTSQIDVAAEGSLLLKVVATLRENIDLRNDMYRIRRWHAYYKPPANRDTNGFGHALNTLENTEALTAVDVQSGLISDKQANDLAITALIHDLGEIRLGNATYGGKSREHESKEYEQFKEILRRDFDHLSDYDRRRLRTLFREVAFGDKNSDLMAKYFNMIEVTGYTTFGYQMFEERPSFFQWEVLAWRILAYHLFRTDAAGNPKDIPAYSQWSEGARQYWGARIHHLDWMVDHFTGKNQDLWIKQVYDQMDLPDRGKVKPIDFSRWADIRAQITG